MQLSSIFIKRPVLATVTTIFLVLSGLVAFNFLSVREYPSIDPPVISINTNYSGASPEVIESQITEILEQALNAIPGIRTLTSTSEQGSSRIRVEFNLNTDLESAANDVRDIVSKATRRLPSDLTTPPTISKADANSDAIIMVTLKSDSKNIMEVSEYATNVLKDQLQTINEVSSVDIMGEKKQSMRIWLDSYKLAARGLTALDVKNAVQKENADLPAGRIQGDKIELTLSVDAGLKTAEEFNNLVIKSTPEGVISLKDVGNAIIAPENDEQILKESGIPMIGLGIIPQPGANAVNIAKEFYKRLEKLKKDLPSYYELEVISDNTKYISRSITEVEETILITFLLVVLVVFAFLRTFRATLIPVIAIPVSLIATFGVMYLFGLSINILTLLGIVLSTSLVVDDAIVVLENIYAKVEKGMNPLEAAHKGASEIFFAVISTTVTLAAVFLPIIFLQGFTGRLFREFGIVMAFSVLISAFISLSLTPMMCSKVLKNKEKHNAFFQYTENIFIRITDAYQSFLQSFLRRKYLAPTILVICFAVIYFVGSLLPSELAPMEDRGVLRVSATPPEGASFNYMTDYADNIIRFVNDSLKEKQAFVTNIRDNMWGQIMLSDKTARKKSQAQIAEFLNKNLKKFSDARISISQQQTISAGGGRSSMPVQILIMCQDFEKLKEIVPAFVEESGKDPVLRNVESNLKISQPMVNIQIDREKARDMQVFAYDAAMSVQMLFGSQNLGYFAKDGKQYPVISQYSKTDRNKPADIKTIFVRNQNGNLVSLDNFAIYQESMSPSQIFHYNRFRSVTVSANLAPDKTIADGIIAMEKVADKVLDESMSTDLSGPSRDYKESSGNVAYAFIFALILVYLILAAQFESFRYPLVIMLTVPLALAGAVGSLWYCNQTLNIFSQIGMIMLVGLVTKNGILIVEFANQRKETGLSYLESVVGACISRFRPIVMTTLTTVIGAVPIALAAGAGAESRVSMGIVIIGGLLFSLILTLFVIPSFYLLLSKKEIKSLEGK